MRLLFGLLSLSFGKEGCYTKEENKPIRCSPQFQNIAFDRKVVASNTCGLNGPEIYYRQTQSNQQSPWNANSRNLRYTCDDESLHNSHSAKYLTDNEAKTTWWQSETLYQSEIQFPNNVTLSLDLGKAYEITYIRLKFHSPRPESMMIEKRTCQTCPWVKYQYYSNTCMDTFMVADGGYVRMENEREALCDSKMSKISPLSGGEIVFPTLEGRPSNERFEHSAILQEFVTATNIRITLVRLNTFGDELFRGTKVLQSYYYAISDFVVGGKMKCNGHGSEGKMNSDGELVCNCQHNTEGADCQTCKPLYNNKPWSRATSDQAQECELCNCNGLTDECVYDPMLKHGRCINCQENADGVSCEKCKQGYFKDQLTGKCVPCGCNVNGAKTPQCDINGTCDCHYGVEGEKCDHCENGFYNLARGGCHPCNCHVEGSLNNIPSCDAATGECECKLNVHGRQCKDCKMGFMGLASSLGLNSPDAANPFGCTACFCYGHSNTCTPAKHFVKTSITSAFDYDNEDWQTTSVEPVQYNKVLGSISASSSFIFPEQFLQDKRYAYNQHLRFNLKVTQSNPTLNPGRLVITGVGRDSTLVQLETPLNTQGNISPASEDRQYDFRIHESNFEPAVEPVTFISVLNNVTSIFLEYDGVGQLDMVELETATEGYEGDEANWVEVCHAPNRSPKGDSCVDHFTFESNTVNPYQACKPCTCNLHSRQPCDKISGECTCEHNTCGHHCDTCCSGFYGDPFQGSSTDCKECPCPNGGACHATNQVPNGALDHIAVMCVECSPGSGGARCQQCLNNYFGDPLGRHGSARPCAECNCNGNINKLMPDNCDAVTGRCKSCLFNTNGEHCEKCMEGFYGNPSVPAHEQEHGNKGCISCDCSKKGSASDVCDPRNGQCSCLPGVGGKSCDQCKPQHFGLTSTIGCQNCDCDPIGAISGDCDLFDGQCQCKEGVTGRRCDQCLLHFWGLSPEGCTACHCDKTGSYSLQCDLDTGKCNCRDGVMGMQCDKCQENFFYDRDQMHCEKCPHCYNLVQADVDRHRKELKRLDDLAREILNNPHDFLNDEQFEGAIADLNDQSQDLEVEVEDVLRSFDLFQQSLSTSNTTAEMVKIQLDQFISSMETCEGTVSRTRVIQRATEGTISVIKAMLDDIGVTLDGTKDQLEVAEGLAAAQHSRHSELRSLYSQAMDSLDKHSRESEKVQFAATAAVETASRAREQITNSLDLIRELKSRLDQFSSNDVLTVRDRIISLRNSARDALEAAENAKNRALDLKIPTDVQTVDNARVLRMAQEIENESTDIQERLEDLQERLTQSRSKFTHVQLDGRKLYDEGKTLLDQADRLMAIVHAARAEARENDAGIHKLIKMATHLIDQIEGHFNTFGNIPDNQSGEPTEVNQGTIDNMTGELKSLNDKLDNISPNIDDLSGDANRKSEDSKISSSEANTGLADNTELLHQAQMLENDVDKAKEESDAKSATLSDMENKLDDKIDQATLKLQTATHAKSQSEAMLEKVDHADKYLTELLQLLSEIDRRNTKQILADMMDDNFVEALDDVQQSYEKHKKTFDDIKSNYEVNLTHLTNQLEKDKSELHQVTEKKERLKSQVENLEQVSSTMPNWCHTNDNANEIGDSRSSRPDADIVEQS